MSGSNNVQKAMDWLASTPEGAKALGAIADAGEALRAQLPVTLSNSELKYVMERLWAQRAVEGWDRHAHFDVQPVATGGVGNADIHLPANLANISRVRDYGFTIKAQIKMSNFESPSLVR